MKLTYVLPVKAATPLAALASYLAEVVTVAQVVVVDGSSRDVFARHAAVWPAAVEHTAVDPDLTWAFGKVNGVLTGLRRARHDAVVIADDDVRYTPDQLARMARLLTTAAAVVPQNYFSPAPWHARWDTARSLVNRALGSDYPGTLGVRRSVLERTGGYDGDVLFENLELIRTVRAAGGRVVSARDLFVRREPPTVRHFLGQRVRQAYDSFAHPARLIAELALLPALVQIGRRRGPSGAAVAAAIAVVVAEHGRRRAGGSAWFPAAASLYAPVWLAERAVCSWAAVASRIARGGVYYPGVGILRRAATPNRTLRRRHRAVRSAPGHPCAGSCVEAVMASTETTGRGG